MHLVSGIFSSCFLLNNKSYLQEDSSNFVSEDESSPQSLSDKKPRKVSETVSEPAAEGRASSIKRKKKSFFSRFSCGGKGSGKSNQSV